MEWNLHFRYQEGKLFWLHDVVVGKGRRVFITGQEAGYVRKSEKYPYHIVSVDSHKTYRHRVVWEMFFGEIPEGYVINHINGKPGDDRIENLECIPSSENNMTHKCVNMYSTNTSGKRGVSFCSGREKWEAKAWCNGKTKHLGRYTTFEDACNARLEWENSLINKLTNGENLESN